MSVGSKVVKLTAKTALKGSFLKVVAASSIFVFGWIVCVSLSELLGIITGEIIATVIFLGLFLFLCLPILLGVVRYVWRMLFSVTDSPIAVFYLFSSKELYVKSLKLIFQFVLKIVFWFLVLNIPSLLLFLLSKSFVFEFFNSTTPVWTANLAYYSRLLLNLTSVIVFFIMLKFYMAPILFVADSNIDVGEAMYLSSVISRKSSTDFIGLLVVNLGWILLSILILPLPFTLPLLLTYYAVHVRFAVAEYNKHIEDSKLGEAGFI